MGDVKIETVQAVNEAFGRGDVAAILELATDDVDWASEPESSIAPWHGVHHGKAELPHFFSALGTAVQVTEFAPLAFTSSDTDVMVVVRFGMKVLATVKSGERDLHHWSRFHDGKISWYRGTEDTARTADLMAG